MTTAYDSLKERTSAVLMNTYGRYPLAVARAEGTRLYDLEGREYVDLLAGIAVANLGHSRPELAEVMAEQARKLVHVSNLFFQEEQVRLAELLVGTSHADKVFFCNSGAEANEGAVKLARRYMRTRKNRDAYKVVTLQGSFHGRTLATLTATGQDAVKTHFQPLPEGFVTVPFGDLEALAQAIDDQTAAVLVEVVQGEGGVRPLGREYATAIEKLCRERDILFMIDEIQTGLCRTGTFWAHEHYGLKPDIFTSAKGLANGLPMGAVLATNEAASGFEPGSHATTFGGGGVLAAVAARTVELLQEEGLARRAAEIGAQAMDMFRELADRHPGRIKDVRGMGLMIGIELSGPALPVWEQLMAAGFVHNVTQGTVLRLLPPLVIDPEDIRSFAGALSDILENA